MNRSVVRQGGSGITALSRNAGVLAFAGMIAFFSLMRPDTFATVSVFQNVLDQAAVLLILGTGLTVVLIIGQFDLSFAATVALAAAGAALLMVNLELPMPLAIILATGAGGVVGLLNGLAVAYGRAPAFIVTMAMGYVVTGVERGITGDEVVFGLSQSFIDLTSGKVLFLPTSTVIAIAVASLIWLILKFTVYGRALRAIGQNITASELAGLPVNRARVLAFVITGLCSGLAGVVLLSRAAQYFPDAGAGLLLPPYAAAFLGAAVIGRGHFGVWSTVFGALFIGVLTTGLTIMGAAPWVGLLLSGVVLVLAVLVARAERGAA